MFIIQKLCHYSILESSCSVSHLSLRAVSETSNWLRVTSTPGPLNVGEILVIAGVLLALVGTVRSVVADKLADKVREEHGGKATQYKENETQAENSLVGLEVAKNATCFLK